MSSLRALVRKDKFHATITTDVKHRLKRDAIDHERMGLNAQIAYGHMIVGERTRFEGLGGVPCLTPWFAKMWTEGVHLGGKFAVLTDRANSNDGFQVSYRILIEADGYCALFGSGDIDLTQTGSFIKGSKIEKPEFLAEDAFRSIYLWPLFGTFHAFGLINSANSELVQVLNPRDARRPNVNPLRLCAWHEIKLTSAPRSAYTGKSPRGFDPEPQRQRWIRGHYADYRKAGLFGRESLRKIFWIPEHTAGDPELGMIIPEYELIS